MYLCNRVYRYSTVVQSGNPPPRAAVLVRMLSKLLTSPSRNWRVTPHRAPTWSVQAPICWHFCITVTVCLFVDFTKMWIQVRTMDGTKNVRIDDLSKLTKVEDLREKIDKYFDAEPPRQRLFYRGKQVAKSFTFFTLSPTPFSFSKSLNSFLFSVCWSLCRAGCPVLSQGQKHWSPGHSECLHFNSLTV